MKDITLNCSQCGKEVRVPTWIGLGVASLLGGDGDGSCCFIEDKGDFCSLECAINWLKEKCVTRTSDQTALRS